MGKWRAKFGFVHMYKWDWKRGIHVGRRMRYYYRAEVWEKMLKSVRTMSVGLALGGFPLGAVPSKGLASKEKLAKGWI